MAAGVWFGGRGDAAAGGAGNAPRGPSRGTGGIRPAAIRSGPQSRGAVLDQPRAGRPHPDPARDPLGFNVSSDTAGYYSLYLIDPVGEVWVLAENLPLPAGSVVVPVAAGAGTTACGRPSRSDSTA